MNIKKVVENHIVQDKVENSLEVLRTYIKESGLRNAIALINDTILLSRNLKSLSKKNQLGLNTREEYQVSRTNISKSVLELCHEIIYLKTLAGTDDFDKYVSSQEYKDWMTAIRNNKLLFFKNFIESYPESIKFKLANKRVFEFESHVKKADYERNLWHKTIKYNTIPSYYKYIQTTELGHFIDDANKHIEQLKVNAENELWSKTIKSNNISSFREYINTTELKYFVKDANRLSEDLRKQQNIVWKSFFETEKNNKYIFWRIYLLPLIWCILLPLLIYQPKSHYIILSIILVDVIFIYLIFIALKKIDRFTPPTLLKIISDNQVEGGHFLVQMVVVIVAVVIFFFLITGKAIRNIDIGIIQFVFIFNAIILLVYTFSCIYSSSYYYHIKEYKDYENSNGNFTSYNIDEIRHNLKNKKFAFFIKSDQFQTSSLHSKQI